jgi:hypothetical protein
LQSLFLRLLGYWVFWLSTLDRQAHLMWRISHLWFLATRLMWTVAIAEW